MTRYEADSIVNAKLSRKLGSKWDEKPIGKRNLPTMEARYRAGMEVIGNKKTVSQVTREPGVSKGFVYKWKRNFQAYKVAKVRRRDVTMDMFRSTSSRPKHVECKARDGIRRKVLEPRNRFPFLGSAKIKAIGNMDAGCSTMDKVLHECGKMDEPEKRKRNKTYGGFERPESLDMVQIDYKTWNGRSHSLFVLDDHSRAMIGWMVNDRRLADDVVDLLRDTFGHWRSVPDQLLSDHGTEFHSIRGGKGASKLDGYCREAGIGHMMGRVRHPQTQGKIERSRSSAIGEMSFFGPTGTLEELRDTMARYVEWYNTERPHQSLGYRCPMDVLLADMSRERMSRFVDCRIPSQKTIWR